MPIKHLGVDVIHLKFHTLVKRWRATTDPGTPTIALEGDLLGQPCSTVGEVVYSRGYGYFICRNESGNDEVIVLKDANDNIIHKRTTYTFSTGGGSYVTPIVKTYGVEYVYAPTPPTREGYIFNG